MTQTEWNNLKIGETIILSDGRVFSVGEICTDEKIITTWLGRGYENVSSVIKILGENNYHTWDCNFNRWSKVK